MIKIELSQFVYEFPFEDEICLYHSLLMKKIFLGRTEWINLKKFLNDRQNISNISVTQLFQMGFIVSSNKEDEKLYRKAKKMLNKTRFLDTIFLVITCDCNLKCKYCYQKRTHFDPKTMKLKTAKKYLKKFAVASLKSPLERNIFLYGGEPLLKINLIKEILEYISELANTGQLIKPYKIFLQTNGTIISNKILEILKKYGIFIGISLDGMKKHHDKARVFNNNMGSFDQVNETINLLKMENIDIAISCTVGNHNYFDLKNIVKYFVEDLNIKEFGFNLLMIYGLKKCDNLYSVPIDKLTEKLIEAYEVAKEYNLDDARLARQILAFVKEKIFINDCDGCGSQVVITPNGRITPCLGFACSEKVVEKKHMSHSLNINNLPLFIKWKESNAFTINGCKHCSAIGICGGGCTYNRYIQNNGDINRPDKAYCNYVLSTLKWMIGELHKRKKHNKISGELLLEYNLGTKKTI